MNLKSFMESLGDNAPPAGLSPYLLSLWYDAKGDWTKAHDIIQDEENKNGSWIHAYLHRKEGDIWNADYWYRRAGKTRPSHSLDDEWKEIANDILSNSKISRDL